MVRQLAGKRGGVKFRCPTDIRGSPRPPEISAALAALGVYAHALSDRELKEQAIAAGGENVLAAVLANALYGAAIGCGMLAEGQMLEQPITGRSDRRSQGSSSGAEG